MAEKKVPDNIADELLEDAPQQACDQSIDDLDPNTALHDEIIAVLKTIFDPEIPVNIYDLGLIYTVDANAETGIVNIDMTLTTPGCPVAQTFPGTIEGTVLTVPNVKEANVEVVWDPPWTMDRMSEAAKLQLGMF